MKNGPRFPDWKSEGCFAVFYRMISMPVFWGLKPQDS